MTKAEKIKKIVNGRLDYENDFYFYNDLNRVNHGKNLSVNTDVCPLNLIIVLN